MEIFNDVHGCNQTGAIPGVCLAIMMHGFEWHACNGRHCSPDQGLSFGGSFVEIR